MGTDNIRKLMFACLLCITANTVYAQQDVWLGIVTTNEQLKKDIQNQIAENKELAKSIESIDNEIYSLDLEIEALQTQFNLLSAEIDKKNLETLQFAIDDLEERLSQLTSENNQLAATNRKKASDLSGIESQKRDMDKYSQIKDEKTYNRYQDILAKPFSQISTNEIREIESQLNSFSDMPDFDEFRTRLRICKSNRALVHSAASLLTSKYDEEKIIQARDKLYDLLSIEADDFNNGIVKLSEAQYAEIDNLDIKLSRYSGGIDYLQSIVNNVNNSDVREKYKNDRRRCQNELTKIAKPMDEDSKAKRGRYFAMIPFLDDWYNKYLDEIKRNPQMHPTQTEKIIMQLKD